MRAAMETWLVRRWYGGVTPGMGLRFLASVHRLLLGLKTVPVQVRLPVPVIVVGNFTVGGTGKTPLVIALARHLQEVGYRPGIVTRGHGRQGADPLRVHSQTPVSLSGDEPRLMFDKTGLPVLVDRDRVAAGLAAVDAGCDLVIADDGLQHRRLARDLEIEVVDGDRGYGNGLLLPAGPLREFPRPCHFRVINSAVPQAAGWSMQLRMDDALSLRDPSIRRSLRSFSGAIVNAVAGIGNPSRFFSALRSWGLDVQEHAFEDHHAFVASDFAGLAGPILMTDKDAVKCRMLGLADAWSVPVEAELPATFFAAVEASLKPNHARP